MSVLETRPPILQGTRHQHHHGKSWHEETKATSSAGARLRQWTLPRRLHAGGNGLRLPLHHHNGGNKRDFLEKFKGAVLRGFDPDQHLQAIGVANQTTMLRGETEEVQNRLKAAMIKTFGAEEIDKHFRFFDTICGATQDRQDALQKLLREPINLLIVIGGYNSIEHIAPRRNG